MQAHSMPRPQLAEQTFEEQFAKFFDYTTGKRRLTCKSRLPIPEDVDASDRAAEYASVLPNPMSLCNNALPSADVHRARRLYSCKAWHTEQSQCLAKSGARGMHRRGS